MRQDERGAWIDDYSDGPVWNWFGLSYSSYCVLPRRALCSMPLDWQQRFVALMEEAHELLPHEACYGEYSVHLKVNGKFAKDPNVPYRHAQPWPLRAPVNGTPGQEGADREG